MVDEARILWDLIVHRDRSRISPREPNSDFLDYCLRNINYSRGQLLQDLFVTYYLKEKTNGFFVEFGATDGVNFSNSFLLERQFLWTGILAEPARCWHDALKRNRANCAIDTRCVWSQSGEMLEFNEVGDLSTIDAYSQSDGHAAARHEQRKTYGVQTISLIDLLVFYKAPRIIDYVSIDTEGSEFAILSAFDFDMFDVRVITVEHNYTPMRDEIFTLLSPKGYARMFEAFSQWDDWYVRI